MTKVSIITPVRIRHEEEARWLVECIGSVRRQTERDIEHIIVNDHTPEAHAKLLVNAVQYARESDSRVRLFNVAGDESGTSAARNAAASLARAELILPLDADDLLDRECVERYLHQWKGEGFLYPSVELFGGDAGNIRVPPRPYDFDLLLRETFLLVGNLHRKDDWRKVGGWKVGFAAAFEDWEYWINAGKFGICGSPCAEAVYYYRRNPHGRTAQTIANASIGLQARDLMRQIHSDVYGGNYPMACCGRSRPHEPAPTPAAPAQGAQSFAATVPGAQQGLTLIRYNLQDDAFTPWYGPVTHTRYMFSRSRNVAYVDTRDVAGLLDIFENRQQVFAVEPVAEPPAPAEPQEVQLADTADGDAVTHATGVVTQVIDGDAAPKRKRAKKSDA